MDYYCTPDVYDYINDPNYYKLIISIMHDVQAIHLIDCLTASYHHTPRHLVLFAAKLITLAKTSRHYKPADLLTCPYDRSELAPSLLNDPLTRYYSDFTTMLRTKYYSLYLEHQLIHFYINISSSITELISIEVPIFLLITRLLYSFEMYINYCPPLSLRSKIHLLDHLRVIHQFITTSDSECLHAKLLLKPTLTNAYRDPSDSILRHDQIFAVSVLPALSVSSDSTIHPSILPDSVSVFLTAPTVFNAIDYVNTNDLYHLSPSFCTLRTSYYINSHLTFNSSLTKTTPKCGIHSLPAELLSQIVYEMILSSLSTCQCQRLPPSYQSTPPSGSTKLYPLKIKHIKGIRIEVTLLLSLTDPVITDHIPDVKSLFLSTVYPTLLSTSHLDPALSDYPAHMKHQLMSKAHYKARSLSETLLTACITNPIHKCDSKRLTDPTHPIVNQLVINHLADE